MLLALPFMVESSSEIIFVGESFLDQTLTAPAYVPELRCARAMAVYFLAEVRDNNKTLAVTC